MIVFPYNRERVIKNNIEAFQKMRIGVMTFNAEDYSYNIIVKPSKCNPSSKKHNLFALGQISSSITLNTSIQKTP